MSTVRLAAYTAAFALLLAWGKSSELGAYFSRGRRAAVVADFPSRHGQDPGRWDAGGFVWRDEALALPPRRSGRVSFTFSKPAGFAADLWVTVVHTPGGHETLTLSLDDYPQPIVLLRDQTRAWGNLLADAGLSGRGLVEEATRLSVTLEARNDSPQEAAVLRRLQIRTLDAPRADFFALPQILEALALFLAVLALWDALAPPQPPAAFHAGAVAWLVAAALAAARPGYPPGLAGAAGWWALIAAAAALAAAQRGGRLSYRRFLVLTALVWAAAAAQFCWERAAGSGNLYFHGSIDQWTKWARVMSLFTRDRGFFSAGFAEREPFHILLLHLWGRLFGFSPFSSLNFELLELTAFAGLAYAVVGALVRDARVMFVLGPAFAIQSTYSEIVDGLERDPTFFILMSLFLYAAVAPRPGRAKSAALTVLAALAVLTRMPALTSFAAAALLLLALRPLQRRLPSLLAPAQDYPPAHLLLFLAALLAVQAPIALRTKALYGSASHWSERQARQQANDEFPERLGAPGFPTRERYDLDSFSGPALTYSDYLFKLHTPWDLARRHAWGLWRVLAHQADSVWRAWGLWATPLKRALVLLALAAGLWLESEERRACMVALWAWWALQNGYALMIYAMHNLDRAVDHALPTFLLLLGWSLAAVARSFRNRARRA